MSRAEPVRVGRVVMEEGSARVRINFGCGSDYREGWVNVDIREEEKWREGPNAPDVVISHADSRLPFEDGVVDYILMDNVIEHVALDRIHGLLEELRRILKPGGVLDVYAPHFKGIGVKYVEHIKGYGINSFWFYHRYFEVKQELFLLSRSRCAGYSGMRFVNGFNGLFNLGVTWQQVCEKFWPGGFEEIHYLFTKK